MPAPKKVPAPDLGGCRIRAALLVGGASLLLGVQPKLGITAIVVSGKSITVMRNFCAVADPQHRMNEMIHFSKNMALLGGALARTGIEEPWP
jgi:hypothetical protein